ncbi:MAG: hypothetical protein QXH45_01655 [Thermosphaera sp.]
MNFVYNNVESLHFYIWLHSYSGTAHAMYGALTEDYRSVPVLYFISQHTTNVYLD